MYGLYVVILRCGNDRPSLHLSVLFYPQEYVSKWQFVYQTSTCLKKHTCIRHGTFLFCFRFSVVEFFSSTNIVFRAKRVLSTLASPSTGASPAGRRQKCRNLFAPASKGSPSMVHKDRGTSDDEHEYSTAQLVSSYCPLMRNGST